MVPDAWKDFTSVDEGWSVCQEDVECLAPSGVLINHLFEAQVGGQVNEEVVNSLWVIQSGTPGLASAIDLIASQRQAALSGSLFGGL